MNFNYSTDESHNPEYNLYGNITEEMINLYGINIKYLITAKINQDEIFGESQYIKVNNSNVFSFFIYPQDSTAFDGDDSIYSKFGLQNLDGMTIFISRNSFELVHSELVNKNQSVEINNIPIGNLIIFNSNKIMEITGFELSSADFGHNNVFDSKLTKNVYKLTLKSYIPNRDDYSETEDITTDYKDFGNLESEFNIKDNITNISTKIKTTNPFGDLG